MPYPIRDSLITAALVAATACAVGTESELAAEDETSAAELVIDDVKPQRPPVTYHADGTVETGGQRFATVSEFQRSEDFLIHDRRCATRKPSRLLRGAPTDCTTSATMVKPEYAPETGAMFTVPVVFHIIKKTDGTGEISDTLIKSQIDILNEDFGALPGTLGENGTASKIRFVLATKDPMGQPTTGINRVTNNTYFDNGTGMHMALHWDTKRYLNIYTSSADGALGYATLASESAGTVDDGVVLLHSTVGRNPPMGGVYNKGRTGTHEVGHYLGLLHTFDNACGTATAPYTSGDLLKDTNAHREPNYECTAAAASCTGAGAQPIENYMNYTPDTCMTKFTPEQVNRMRCSILNYRQMLVMNEQGVGVPPVAKFSATLDGLSAKFVDESTDADGTVTARNWTFGDGATSTDLNPTHTYATAGTYAVTLEVTDNSGATHKYTGSVAVAESTACQPGGDDCEISGGCETGGSSFSGSAALMIAVLFGLRRRRQRVRSG